MGIVEIIGYSGDGFIECKHCTHARYEKAEDNRDGGHSRDFGAFLDAEDIHPVTDQVDFGPEGISCECGAQIQQSYCTKCGNATDTIGDAVLCDNCVKKENRAPVLRAIESLDAYLKYKIDRVKIYGDILSLEDLLNFRDGVEDIESIFENME